MKKVVVLLILVFSLVGCSGKFNYVPPQPVKKINNSITINEPKNEVWKKIMPSLGSSFFVINNIDRGSGFINISYSGDPEKYINCGTIDSLVKNARGERHYIFPASTHYKKYETMIGGQLVYYVRKMDLEGRANIIVQAIEENQTLVTVNIRYVVAKDILMSNPQNQSRQLNESISFSTNGSDTFSEGRTTCYPTGQLEKEILSAVGL